MLECQRVSGPPRLVRGRPLRGANRIECLQRMLKPAVPSPPLAPPPAGRVRVLVIDNYDSFTFNLVQYLGELGAEVEVFKNDGIDVAGIRARRPHGLLISPGPCTPNEAGISLELLQALGGSLPILGVCLGHQAIGQAFGGRVVRAGRLMHGKTSPILHDGRGLFDGIASPFEATRYHSLLVEAASLPACLEISAWTAEGEIMGLRHRQLDVEGVQFHPESVLTEGGHQMIRNFLDM
jgi:anthranilate synthase/aminodeoxychorismate synthase-like glutamine amidotransferase